MECQYNVLENQKTDSDLILGYEVRNFMSEHQFTPIQLNNFYASVRKYFTTVCDYVIKTFPLSDELLQHASVANPRNRSHQFNFMEDKLNEIENKFAHYQIDEQVHSLVETGLETKRADEMWVQITCKRQGNRSTSLSISAQTNAIDT